MVAKCLAVHDFNDMWYPPPGSDPYNSPSVKRIVNGNLDEGGVLSGIRVCHMRNDLSGLLPGGYKRSALITFGLSPCLSSTPGWPPAPDCMASKDATGSLWWNNTRLMMSGDWTHDQTQADLYSGSAALGVYNNYGGDSNKVAYALDGVSMEAPLVLTSKGQLKIQRAVAAAKVLRDNNWTVAFGISNEPNNLDGYVCTVSPSSVSHDYWFPMQALVFAYFYRAVAGAIRDAVYSADSSWVPSIGMADVSFYTASMSGPLDMTWWTDPNGKVPPINPGGPDSRYINLVLRWWNDDGLSWLSPQGRDIHPSFFTYHLYASSPSSFMTYQKDALDVNRGHSSCFFKSPYWTSQAPFSDPNVGYALTEFAQDGGDANAQAAFFNAVWTNPDFHSLPRLKTAYWYADWNNDGETWYAFSNDNPPANPSDHARTAVGNAINSH